MKDYRKHSPKDPSKDKGKPSRKRGGGPQDGGYKGEKGKKTQPDRQGKRSYGNPRGVARDKSREKFKGKATLWGVHAVIEAWKNPARTIKALYVTEEALKGVDRALLAMDDRPQPTIIVRRDLDRMLPPGAVHQGIAIDVPSLEEVFIQDFVVSAAQKERSMIVVLDQVTDPHNVGAIMRSACAFGADGLVMQSRHAPDINGTLAKTASGAAEHIPVAYETNLSRAINHLQEAGYVAVALDERGETDIASYDFPAKVVIVLGAEGKGLRQGLRENCDVTVRLPTGGPIGSLNVSNAAAVALYACSACARK